MRKCRGCQRDIEFARLPQGGWIPLERVTTYRIVDGVAERVGEELISHFRTCPDANRFSKGADRKKRRVGGE